MNLPPLNTGALYRAALSFSAAALLAACAGGPPVGSASEEVFDLTEAQRQARFPKRQAIGVVELSGARIQERPYQGSAEEKEYLATGGAFLIKRLQSPILAQAPEILVTPEAAFLKGPEARVRQDQRLINGAGPDTEIRIDGSKVQMRGPHIIRDLGTGKVSLFGGARLPEETPAPAVVEPAPASVAQSPVNPPVAETSRPVKVSKSDQDSAPPTVTSTTPVKIQSVVPVQTATPAAVPAKKPTVAKSQAQPKPKAKPAPAPASSKPASKPEVNTQALRSLMREPTE